MIQSKCEGGATDYGVDYGRDSKAFNCVKCHSN